MKIREIRELLGTELLCGWDHLDEEVGNAFCCDMMSDVLAFAKDQSLLMTGLINPQVIRTANMMDMPCVLFVRGKKPSDEMIKLAEECGIVLMQSEKRAYELSGILYANGLRGGSDDD